MKIIAIGDIHGRRDWQSIVSKDDFDKAVFIEDYFDSNETISPDQEKQNFRDLIAFKKAFPDKVVLLIGNHDFHYMRFSKETYGGYQAWQHWDYEELVHGALNEGLLQMCHVQGNFLFSHAGVTKTWCQDNDIDLSNLEESINDLFLRQPAAFRFTSGNNMDKYGDDITQTPIWVRPQSLLVDGIDGYTHIVGHTHQRMINIIGNIILIDTMGTSGQYLEIVDGVPESKKPVTKPIDGAH